MPNTAELFTDQGRQAVRLPSEVRFEGSEVNIRRDAKTGDIILSQKPNDWESFFRLLDEYGPAEEEFMQGIEDPLMVPEDIF